MIRTSAPGKCIFFGEHAVLPPYNQSGVVTAISKRTTVEIIPHENMLITSSKYAQPLSLKKHEFATFERKITAAFNKNREQPATKPLRALRDDPLWNFYPFIFITGQLLKDYQKEFKGFHATITSDIPKNLGSSSAAYAAFTCALLHHMGITSPGLPYYRPDVERYTNLGDTLAHGGNVSGIDGYAVTYGGLGTFEKRYGGCTLGSVDPSAKKALSLLGIDSGKDTATFEAVDLVQEQYAKDPVRIMGIMRELGAIARDGTNALFSRDFGALNLTFDRYYETMKNLNIYTPELEHIISLSRAQGLHAKTTGCGRGGCCIALLSEQDALPIANYHAHYAPHNYTAFPLTTHADGVRLEHAD